jgi:hypothetical protein
MTGTHTTNYDEPRPRHPTRTVPPLPACVASSARSSSPSSRMRPTNTSLSRASTPASIAQAILDWEGARKHPSGAVCARASGYRSTREIAAPVLVPFVGAPQRLRGG